ncbi:oligosaccharide flippase family protein [Paenibacillus spongiae]|uniref:Oligosaccharide flippase family protein n=1 Tax=Paenibacillus spongiae TaxID=2909671 RepID=A0ABY5SIK8_9BACL|nr:oligosaccharide flippase family protein [Paenibacillus spongiae]UVI33413.1 oligosaccharide flippase family protein [Paenibacillus spongiae]
MKQTAFRASAIFLVKVIGLIGRISLTRLVGAEGVGLYQIAYSFYGLSLILITGGLPTALALSSAKNASQGWAFFKILSIVIFVLGGAASLLTFHFSSLIAQTLGNPHLDFTIRCLSPAFLVVPLLNLLRGYLQGLERYNLIAISEITEQFVRVASLVLFVLVLLPGGIAKAVGGGVIGTTVGALFAFLVLTVLLSFTHDRIGLPSTGSSALRPALAALLRTSAAIAFTRLLIPASDFIDAILIPNRLQTAGYSVLEATQIYGVLTGMAIILTYMPTILTAALSHTLTMKITAVWQAGHKDEFFRQTSAGLEAGWLWGLTSGLFLFQYAADLSWLIFGTTEAASPIRYLALLPFVVGTRELTTSILWAQNRKKIPFSSLISAILISIVLLYFLLAIPGFGYIGAAISFLSLELIAAVWNLWALKIIRSGYIRTKVLLLDVIVLIMIAIAVYVLNASLENVTWSKPLMILPGMVLFCGCAGVYMKIRFVNLFRSSFN